MKKTITILMSLIMVMLMGYNAKAQLLLNEQFDYPVGDSLSLHGWNAHSGTGPIFTVNGNLSYTGYCTPSGQSALITSAKAQDMNHTFTAPTTGSVYAALLINVSNATATGDYFFHFMTGTTTFVGRVFLKRDATDSTKFKLGVLKGSNVANAVYTSTLYSFNTTNLIVLKYTINSGAGDDVVSLFVNPATATEGAPTVVASDVASTDLASVGIIALRQGNQTISSTLIVDGLRIATTWTDAIGFSGVVTAPVVTSVAATGITSTTAICGGNVTSDGGAAITERGICYGITADPTIAGTKVVVAGTNGAFTGNVGGLTANTAYHYRAYATNSAGTSYGNDLTFTTASGAVAPVVSTGAVSAITSSTATVAGDVSNDGGSTITERGICWSTTANPTTANTKVAVSGTTGVFSGNLTGLTGSTVYYARAYAINTIGTSYGSDINFTTTVAAIPCATIAELRAKIADNSTLYQLTGEAFLTYKHASRNQKYIQDATAAVLIDDYNPTHITTIYNIGDGITGIKGKLESYFGLLEFHPVEDPGMPTSINNVVNPLVLTLANMQDTAFMRAHQSKLIKFNSAAFSNPTGLMKFSTNKKYILTDGSTTDSLFYTFSYIVDYITPTPLTVPSGNGSIIGNVNMSFNKYYITARSKNDISLLVGINEVENETVGVYPNPTTGKFTVNIDKFNNGDVKIYSMVGTLITSQQVNKGTNEFDLSAYGKGMYFVKYTDAKTGKSWTEKLIVK
jgi:hypothetical protein